MFLYLCIEEYIKENIFFLVLLVLSGLNKEEKILFFFYNFCKYISYGIFKKKEERIKLY